jgi:hypothetical protein
VLQYQPSACSQCPPNLTSYSHGTLSRFGPVGERFGTVREGLGTVREQLGTVRERFGTMRERFGTVLERFGASVGRSLRMAHVRRFVTQWVTG